jgi:hypothetical protein
MTENNQIPDATVSVSAKNECTTNLLLDEPELIDAFNGPHGRIAANIADLISREDAKGISIGVEGSWGSGKSTVARLLIQKLQSQKNIAIISFDAWAHEGDPLRRTFLETLIRRLKELKWIDEKRWDEHIEILANRQETVTTKDELTFSRSGALVAFLFLLLPLGTQFIAGALKEIERYPPIRQRFWLLSALGLSLTALPFVVMLVLYKSKSDVLGIFFNKGLTGKTTVTQKTGNPTSIEFEDRFTELIQEALTEPARRIVILLDNLDRVDSKDALLLWSTLQTFLQHRDLERQKWRDRLWLVVLYDLKGLSSLWQSEDVKPQPPNPEKIGPIEELTNSKPQAAASFIDKSFQIRFEVPSLVLSDWGKFLEEKLETAFPNHSKSDWHGVYRVVAIGHALRQTQGDPPPTIRELKLFVNQIGAIHRQWTKGPNPEGDTFRLAHIAYYVYLRRSHVDIVTRLLNDPLQSFPPKEYQDLLGDGVRENLAAMAFNVEVKVAQEMLFSDKIRTALTTASSEGLQLIETQIPKGFWGIFEQIISWEWTGDELVKVADAAWALEESKLLINAPESARDAVTGTMCRKAKSVAAWVPLDEKRASGLATLVKWKMGVVNEENHSKLLFVGSVLEGAVMGLAGHALRANIPFNAKTWLQWMDLIFTETLAVMKADAFKAFAGRLFSLLDSNEVLPNEGVSAILEVVSELANNSDTDDSVRERLKSLAGNGKIMSRLDRTAQVSAKSIGLAFYVSLRYAEPELLPAIYESFTETTKISPPLIDGFDTVNAFTDALDRFDQLPLLFRPQVQSKKLKSLLLSAIREMLRTDNAARFFTEEDLVERIEFVYREVAVNSDDKLRLMVIVEKFLPKQSLASQITAGEFHSKSWWLYSLMLKSPEGQREVAAWCNSALQALSFDLWQSVLVGPRQLLGLAFRLLEVDSFELGDNYAGALKDYASRLASGALGASVSFTENAAALLGRVDGFLRLNFRLHLLTLLRQEPKEEFFNQFGEELAVHLVSSDRGVELLTLFASIDINLPTLQWLSQTLTQNSQWILDKYSRHSALDQFKSKMELRISQTPPDRTLYDPLSAIARVLHLELLPEGALAFTSFTSGKARIVFMDAFGFRGELAAYLSPDDTYPKRQPAWSPDGLKMSYVARESPGWVIYLLDFHEQKKSNIFLAMVQDDSVSSPWFSPDGTRLAFVKNECEEIWMTNISTQKMQKVSDKGDGRPCWSPNGEKIAFQNTWEDLTSVGIMNTDGSEREMLTTGPFDIDPSWSADGSRIVFAQLGSGIYELSVGSGTEPELILAVPDAYSPILLPDDKTLLFQSGEGAEAGIIRFDRSTGEQKKIADGSELAWVNPKGMPADTLWLPLSETK